LTGWFANLAAFSIAPDPSFQSIIAKLVLNGPVLVLPVLKTRLICLFWD
jgi:hypothetical protein